MYVYRVYNSKTKKFITGSAGRLVWGSRVMAERAKPTFPKHMVDLYEVKKYELVEVPCE